MLELLHGLDGMSILHMFGWGYITFLAVTYVRGCMFRAARIKAHEQARLARKMQYLEDNYGVGSRNR